MRYAIYFTPPPNHPLHEVASHWLGRDVFSGESIAPPHLTTLSAGEIAFYSASARRYGFHGTLKAPFYLQEKMSEEQLLESFTAYCEQQYPIRIPPLTLSNIDGFFVLVPQETPHDLNHFANDIIMHFDRFSAPLNERDIIRRNPETLTQRQLRYLTQWGYPYVFEEFRFHMTLSSAISIGERRAVKQALEDWFAPILEKEFDMLGLALFVEKEPGAPFLVHSYHSFAASNEEIERKTA